FARSLAACFFFCRYAAPRALPSFPTRRSSDLLLAGPAAALARAGRRPRLGGRADGGGLRGRPLRAAPVPGPGRRRAAVRPAGPPDRKSTRLNSSHVKISYAVFCLKKKTTNSRP